ncbi:PPOX class F420-dependent oxidoreductase [Rhizohabitans arisaemae]|uniref:PPOX class F420-dependent oxidoreductase n=1 Tax=Rhizohabitans arisaemae TaxID=2720610 RepID=UPI0024B20BB3|nr:PPOX class F420-dependent oxidoreductase [Rhizohabitans arisaemae]
MEPIEDWREFVMTGTRTGKLAITREDGRPHVTPVWFVVDGEDVLFNTGESTVKGKALRRDPRVALCVDDQVPLYSFVILEGGVSLSRDLAELRHWAAVIGGRYMGPDRAREYGERNGVPGELLVRLHVSKVIALRDVAG